MKWRLFSRPKDKPAANPEPSGWRQAADASALPVPDDFKHVPPGMRLAENLGVSEGVRLRLESYIVSMAFSRPEDADHRFREIAHEAGETVSYPPDLIERVRRKHPRKMTDDTWVMREAANIYLRYEKDRWHHRIEVNRSARISDAVSDTLPLFQWRTSEDVRVCDACRELDRVVFLAPDAPALPHHWECRCAALGVLELEELSEPIRFLSGGTVESLTRDELHKKVARKT